MPRPDQMYPTQPPRFGPIAAPQAGMAGSPGPWINPQQQAAQGVGVLGGAGAAARNAALANGIRQRQMGMGAPMARPMGQPMAPRVNPAALPPQ